MSKKDNLSEDKNAVFKLTQELFKHYPGMKTLDKTDHARAAAAITHVLGGVMAVFLRDDPGAYELLMRRIAEGTKEVAEGILKRSEEMREESNKADPYKAFRH